MNSLTTLPPMPPNQDFSSMGSMDDYGAAGKTQGLWRFFVFLKKYWWIPTLTFLLSSGAAIAFILLTPPVFTSSAAMWETEKLHLNEGALFTDDAETYIGTQIELLKSGHMWQATIERLRSADTNAVPLGKDGFPLEITLDFKEAPKSSVFIISAGSANAAFSQNFLNVLMNEYLEYKKTIRKSVSGDTAASISAQVEAQERDLKSAQDALSTFQRTNNLAILQEEGTVSGGYLAKLQTELSDLRLDSKILDATVLEQKSDNSSPFAPASDAADFLHSLNSSTALSADSSRMTPFEELTLLKMQREKLSKYLRPKHPKIVTLDTEIARAKKLMEMFQHQGSEQLAASQQTVKMKIDSVSASIKEWEPRVTEANALIAEAEHLKINVARTQSLYDRLSGLLQSVDISRNTDLETLAILEPASTAKRSHKHEMTVLALGVIFGLGVGGGIVFLIEKRDDRFTSVIDVNSTLGDAIVGLLPEVTHKRKEPLRLLEINDSRHGYAESYRSLRSALLFSPAKGERPKVLLITSAIPGEGKSTIAANLARTLALSGSRVLLVDGDLRKGHLHRTLEMQSEPGLAELLHDNCAADTVIQKHGLPNLHFIACGTRCRNPSDLFLDSKLDEQLTRWRREFDFVVIDSSPLFAADDASCIAPKVDGILFIVRRGHSSARAVNEALDLLARRQANVLGVVFNGADTSSRNYHYYKYGDYNVPAKTEG